MPPMLSRAESALVFAVSALAASLPAAAQNGIADAESILFRVRIENVSNRRTLKLPTGRSVAVPLSAGVWVVHTGANPIFTPGVVEPGLGLKGLAEAGMATQFAANLGTLGAVRAHGVFDKPRGRPRGMPNGGGGVDRASASTMLQQGQHFEFAIHARRGERLSLAMMIAQSNDALIATQPDGIAMFDSARNPIAGSVTSRLALWDAGTEVNEEPGMGRSQGLRQGAPHAGDPERMPVRVISEAEFGSRWPAADQIVRVTITPKR